LIVRLTLGEAFDDAGDEVIATVVVPVTVKLSAPLCDASVFASPR